MTPALYFSLAHWVAEHVDRHRPCWRGRRKLRRMLRRMREQIPSIQITYETVKRYK